ncbi:MAG: histidine kinase, partial [Treponema sp.]|nr:histidine kinase [Treponema sp.]
MKSLSGLARMLLAAGLPLLLCGCAGISAGPDSQGNSLYINLNDFPLYAKNGFDPAHIASVPDRADGSWRVKGPEERRKAAKIRSLGLPETPERVFLSPFRERDREYTLLIPFAVTPEQFALLRGKKPVQPGLFLAALGNNWEVFFNGRLIRSEAHLDDDGQIKSGRGWRYISLPLDSSLFVPGTNMLAFRIIGAPNADTTGLWYEEPYYIGEYQAILKNHNESL